jgi:hypothetical protein
MEILDVDDDDETLKRKKIRKILLLKTDEELKKINKKKINIMINSKTTQEMNKSYNIYNIPLSEKSKIYSYFVKIEEKIFPNNNERNFNILPLNSCHNVIENKKIERPIKLQSSSIFEDDSISPVVSFSPKKIELGFKRVNLLKKSMKINEKSIQKFINEKINLNLGKEIANKDRFNKSTRIENRGLYRLVDKILMIKMNENTQDTIKQNIIKLRKYCNKLKKKKKKVKKVIKPKNQSMPKVQKNKTIQKNYLKRMTLTNNKSYLKKSLLGSKDLKLDRKRVEIRLSTAKQLNINLIEIEEMVKEKEKEKEKIKEFVIIKDKGKKLNKNSSSKIIKNVASIKKDKYFEASNRKKGLRRMQTLNGNNKKIIEDLKKIKPKKIVKNENNKNEESNSCYHQIEKEFILSSKFQRPSKFLFNSTNNRELYKSKINSQFDLSKMPSSKDRKGFIQSFIYKDKDKDYKEKDRMRSSTKKNKRSAKIYENFLHSNRKDDKYIVGKIEKKSTFNKEEVIKSTNILSEFNKKQAKKKLIGSPAKKNEHNKKTKLA